MHKKSESVQVYIFPWYDKIREKHVPLFPFSFMVTFSFFSLLYYLLFILFSIIVIFLYSYYIISIYYIKLYKE